MQQTYSPNKQSKAAAQFFENSANESWQCVYPDSTTAMTSPDGTILRFDPHGRITAIVSPCGRELKTFTYSAKGLLLSFTNQGYKLSKAGDLWTDGFQLFNIEVTVDNLAVITVIEHSCGAVTRLFPDGSFVIAVSTALTSQYAVHHSSLQHHPVSQIDYPDGSKRSFQYDKFVEMTMLDEPDGYWLKAESAWLHYNSIGGQDGLRATAIKVDFNGNLLFEYCNGTSMIITASGERTYTFAAALAA